MKDNLKPCPFCGNIPVYSPDPSEIFCHLCCYSIEDDCKQSAINKWNTRQVPTGNREKLAKVIHNLSWPSSIWENQCELVKERYYKRAGAVISSMPEWME